MDEHRLRAALVLAELGSLRQSARALHCSQSTLSEAIKSLERDLGCTLFERGARGMKTLPGSEAIFESFRTLINQMSTSRSLARDLAAGMAGRVRIQLVTSVSEFLLPALFSAWYKQAPGLALDADVAHPLRQLEALRGGRCDLAIVRRGVDAVGCVEHLLLCEPMLIVFPASWRGSRQFESRADLEREPMVTLVSVHGPGLTSDVNRFLEGVNIQPIVAKSTDCMDALMAMVAAGIGWSVLPASLYRRHSDQIAILWDAVHETTDLVACIRENTQQPAVEKLLTVLQNVSQLCLQELRSNLAAQKQKDVLSHGRVSMRP